MGGVQVGWGGVSVQSVGEMRKDFCPKFLQPFLESIDRGSCNNGSRELIPVFHNPHRKCRPSPSALARTLEYLEGVSSQAASSRGEEKQVRINIQKALEYLEGGNEVIPKSSPLLQRMKAQSLQSLFVGEVTHASYQPYSQSLNSLQMVDVCNKVSSGLRFTIINHNQSIINQSLFLPMVDSLLIGPMR